MNLGLFMPQIEWLKALRKERRSEDKVASRLSSPISQTKPSYQRLTTRGTRSDWIFEPRLLKARALGQIPIFIFLFCDEKSPSDVDIGRTQWMYL